MTHTALRHKLPRDRAAVVHRFNIAGHEGYIRIGLYETGEIGEVFIEMAKAGSTMSGLMDAFATAVSVALQYGAPLDVLADKFIHSSFEPSGVTDNEHIRQASSVVDYVFRWLMDYEVRRTRPQ